MNPFYMVITTPTGCFTVRYVEPPNWTIQEIGMNYSDPAEARREFKKFARFQQHTQLSKPAFDRRILRHSRDMEKFLSWSKG